MVIISAGHRHELNLSLACATSGRVIATKAQIHRCIKYVEAIEY
jgi:hypothetical protein